MKKGAFSGLLYREWALMKKSLVLALVLPFCMTVLSLLVVLSFRFGNLALLSDELKDNIFGDFAFIIKALPALAVCFIVSAPAEASVFEIKTVWTRFLRSTPVGGFKLALAKYTVITALTLLAAGGAIGATALMCRAMGEAFTKTDAAVALVLLAAAVLLSVAMQVATAYFKSTDKGGLAAMGAMLVCLVPVVVLNDDLLSDSSVMTGAERINLVMEKIGSALPFVPFVIAGALLLGLVATTMIYKRREK